MLKLNKTTQNELNKVQGTIKKELSNEKIIQEIYEYIFQKEGKKTRALLCLLSSKSQNIKPKNRINLASIIELLHTATLVHDDVVDESELRRGEKSVNQVWTNSYSVLMGDFIYSKAFILMVKIELQSILDELSQATNDIAKGEIIQLYLFEKNKMVELHDLLKVSYLKTGRLFEASAKTGAILANKTKIEIKRFGLLGKFLGTAFQIRDDILDYESYILNTGKPLMKDFKEGKITFPLYFAFKNAKPKDQKFIMKQLGAKKISQKNLRYIYDLVKNEKAQLEVNALLEKYIKKSFMQLNYLKDDPCYNELEELINFSKIRKI